MLVTRVSPAVGLAWWRTAVTVPAALTVRRLRARGAAKLPVVLLLQAGLADQVDAGEAGHRQVPLLHLLRR